MARLLIGAALGVAIGVVVGAALGIEAQDAEVVALAAAHDIEDPNLLQAAADTVGVSPARYLATTFPHAPPPPTRDWVDNLLSCLAWHESRHTPSAVNPRSGASGYLQFLPSTFRQTPPGRRGDSIFSVAAQLEAGRWMINQGRLKEWTVWWMCA